MTLSLPWCFYSKDKELQKAPKKHDTLSLVDLGGGHYQVLLSRFDINKYSYSQIRMVSIRKDGILLEVRLRGAAVHHYAVARSGSDLADERFVALFK